MRSNQFTRASVLPQMPAALVSRAGCTKVSVQPRQVRLARYQAFKQCIVHMAILAIALANITKQSAFVAHRSHSNPCQFVPAAQCPEQSALLGKLKTALAEANYAAPEPIMTILNQASAKSMQSQLHAEANKLGKLEKKVRPLEEAIAKSKTAWTTTYVQQVQQKLTQDAATCQQVIASAQMELVQAKQELSIQSQQTQMLISQLVQTQTQAPCPPTDTNGGRATNIQPMGSTAITMSEWNRSMLTQSLAEHGPMTAMPDMLARPAEQDALAKAAAQHANNIDILQPWEHERTSHAPAPNPSGGQDWMRTGAPTAITPSPVTPPGVWDGRRPKQGFQLSNEAKHSCTMGHTHTGTSCISAYGRASRSRQCVHSRSNHQARNPKIPKSNMGNIAEQPCQMHVAGMATPPHSEVASCTPSPVPTEVATDVDDMAEDGSMQRLE